MSRSPCAWPQGAFHLARSGFRIIQWEPAGEGKTKGEALILLPDSAEVFVEVKQPGWHGGALTPRKSATTAAAARRLDPVRDDTHADATFDGSEIMNGLRV